VPTGAGPARQHKHWVLSRALYRCKYVPLGQVAAGDRRAVLRNLLLAWAPFDRAEFRVVWQGEAVLALAWDRELVAGLLAAAGSTSPSVLWPETLMHEAMATNGVRLVRCLEGFEAQAWQGRHLHASRWWVEPPTAGEAEVWLRSLGLDLPERATMPAAQDLAWLRRPWAELQGLDGLMSTTSRLERVAVGATMAGLTALTGAQAHQVFAAYQERQSLQGDHERIQLEAAPVAAARERAEALAREAEALATQLTGVLPLEVLQHLDDVLPPAGVTLKELELSGNQLRLALELGADLQRGAVVKDLQSGGWLTKVNEARDGSNRGWVVFDAVLLGPRPSATFVRPARAASKPASVAPGAPLVFPGQQPAAGSKPVPPERAASTPSAADRSVPRATQAERAASRAAAAAARAGQP
jgi:hypothetical protein